MYKVNDKELIKISEFKLKYDDSVIVLSYKEDEIAFEDLNLLYEQIKKIYPDRTVCVLQQGVDLNEVRND